MSLVTIEKHGPIWELLDKIKQRSEISELVINGDRKVFAEIKGQFTQLNQTFTAADITQFCDDLYKLKSGMPRPLASKVLEVSLEDGSRAHVIFPPYAPLGPAISIRKFNYSISSLDEHGQLFGLNQEWVSFFKAIVRARMNIIVCGGTSSGKTTFLNLLLQSALPHERMIIIEEILELKISLPNQVRLVASSPFDKAQDGMSIRDLVKSSLRMRPDRLIIGEVRGEEAFDLMMAWNTGHEGSFTSLHANSPLEALQRLEALFMLASSGISLIATRKMILNAVDFILFLQKDRKGQRKVANVIELNGMEGPTLLTQTLAEMKAGELTLTGMTSPRLGKLHEIGGLDKGFFQGKV